MAYTATVLSAMRNVERVSRSLGVFCGQVNIASYNATLVSITAITKYFIPTTAVTGSFGKGIVAMVADGISSNGYGVKWDAVTGAFRAYYPTSVALPVDSNVASGAALLFGSGGGAAALHATSAVGSITLSAVGVEAAANDNVGSFNFVAIGFIHA